MTAPVLHTPGLTPRQREVYLWIKSFIESHGYSPSYSEMMAGLSIKSRGHLHGIIDALKHRHYLTYLPYVIRSIEITDRRAA